METLTDPRQSLQIQSIDHASGDSHPFSGDLILPGHGQLALTVRQPLLQKHTILRFCHMDGLHLCLHGVQAGNFPVVTIAVVSLSLIDTSECPVEPVLHLGEQLFPLYLAGNQSALGRIVEDLQFFSGHQDGGPFLRHLQRLLGPEIRGLGIHAGALSRQLELVYQMPRRRPERRFSGGGIQVAEGLPLDQISVIGHVQDGFPAGSYTNALQDTPLHGLAVTHQLPGEFQVGQVGDKLLVIEVVSTTHAVPALVLHIERRLTDLHFFSGGLFLQIREHDAVQAHIRHGVSHVLPKGSRIPEGDLAVLSRLDQRFVREVPQEASLEPGILPDQVPVQGKVAVAVAFGVGILAHDERPFIVASHALFHPVLRRVHRGQNITGILE
ncbi:unknown [Clostridium sp. CAG:1013]|nr:unknown [Clostridium sp. CAG:1013]